MSNIPYASAVIHFLDRDSQTTKAMTYPISRIELMETLDNQVVCSHVFVVDESEHWDCVFPPK